MMTTKDLFLSYGREDDTNAFVEKLKHDLEENGFSVWQDTESIPSGSTWVGEIAKGGTNCKALLAVITKKYVSSQYCTKELHAAHDNKKAIFPLIRERDWEAADEDGKVKFLIRGINYTFFRPEDDYEKSLQNLIKGLKLKGEL